MNAAVNVMNKQLEELEYCRTVCRSRSTDTIVVHDYCAQDECIMVKEIDKDTIYVNVDAS